MPVDIHTHVCIKLQLGKKAAKNRAAGDLKAKEKREKEKRKNFRI